MSRSLNSLSKMKLLLPLAEMERMKAHAESAYPTECCGLLIGVDGEGRIVQEARPCLNAALEMHRVRYMIHPLALLEAEKELAGTGRVVLGIYHFHPDYKEEPSSFDLEHAWPWYSYLILKVTRGRFEKAASWRLSERGNEFIPEEVMTVGKT